MPSRVLSSRECRESEWYWTEEPGMWHKIAYFSATSSGGAVDALTSSRYLANIRDMTLPGLCIRTSFICAARLSYNTWTSMFKQYQSGPPAIADPSPFRRFLILSLTLAYDSTNHITQYCMILGILCRWRILWDCRIGSSGRESAGRAGLQRKDKRHAIPGV